MESPKDPDKSLELFKQGISILENSLSGLDDTELDYIPIYGGWTIREIIHHITDGDDLWKTGIKMALGNERAEFTLQWYAAFPQTEWAKRWNYDKRSIDTSLALLKINRQHIVQLLDYMHDWWTKSVQFRDSNGDVIVVTVGFIIQMQADHVIHHVKRISDIRKEISGN